MVMNKEKMQMKKKDKTGVMNEENIPIKKRYKGMVIDGEKMQMEKKDKTVIMDEEKMQTKNRDKAIVMDEEKIQMKKRDKAKELTFYKRKRGIFKKAGELSILCDADVALIIFSSSGNLYQYSTSRMNEILERHSLHSKNLEKMEQPSTSSELQPVECEYSMLSKEEAKKSALRKMIGEGLQGMNTGELEQLEKSLEAGLSCLMKKKAEKITTEIQSLQQKGRQLIEQNNRLRNQKNAMEISRGGNLISVDWGNKIGGDGPSSEPVIRSGRLPREYESSDTSLKLGLNY